MMSDLDESLIRLRLMLDHTPSVESHQEVRCPFYMSATEYVRAYGYPWSVTYAYQRIRSDN
jgi:hypothetical protein